MTSVVAYQDHLRHAARLPMTWVQRETCTTALASARRHRRNLGALALDSVGDERRAERVAEESGIALDLQRVESKLNAVIELFAIVLERDLDLPEVVEMRFNAHGIEWRTSTPPSPRESILVRIHLDACPALPLELDAVALAPLENAWAAAVFVDLRSPVPELMERLVFREHRRRLAESIEIRN
jgi:hypothetical protein